MEQFHIQFVEKSYNLKRRGGKTFVQLRSLRLRSSNRFVRSFTCIFFPSDSFVLNNIFKLKRITCKLLLSKIFRYRAQFKGNFFRCVGARAYLRALMTRKSCVVGMHNATLRNHLKGLRAATVKPHRVVYMLACLRLFQAHSQLQLFG